eukprot:TRINITY_DN40186_c0_g1_i1.p1 TRINITY_DN40186_c0_g1~~TRINITY_DN40186_c0_g1_i1.p1  ORF type:complete len:697 (-),score=102.55 TRINITY_DN40186_c0_g1_i1:265-2355(-)
MGFTEWWTALTSCSGSAGCSPSGACEHDIQTGIGDDRQTAPGLKIESQLQDGLDLAEEKIDPFQECPPKEAEKPSDFVSQTAPTAVSKASADAVTSSAAMSSDHDEACKIAGEAVEALRTSGAGTLRSDDEAVSIIEEAVETALVARRAEEIKKKKQQYEEMLAATRKGYTESYESIVQGPANRYGADSYLPCFESGFHVPVLALINPMSGGGAGRDILALAWRSDYYKRRFFNIIDVVRSPQRAGLLDIFRIELCAAKDEAATQKTRPRLVSGGGDGTASFAIFMLFLALKADPERADEGLADVGNGFIWTDQEMALFFPAIAQMPLGSANDFGNITGWGQKYPGDTSTQDPKCRCCLGRAGALSMLHDWISSVVDPKARVVNFDVWGLMPPKGQSSVNFKLAELNGQRGKCPNTKIDGKRQLALKQAGKPIPFFVCLYFSAGFGAYMTSRFQLNRRKTPFRNRAEYTRQALGIICETTPPQLIPRLDGVQIDCNGDEPYFPPRRDQGTSGRNYREVGFYNINWQAHALHGAERASLLQRLFSKRRPVSFNDGLLDMFRWKFKSLLKNPGLRIQTDRKKDMTMRVDAGKGKGVFFQWDGESRFAFSPTGDAFDIFIRKVCNIPVVIGPFVQECITGELDNGKEVLFSFSGESPEECDDVRRRVLQCVRGELDNELNASVDEIKAANLLFSSQPSK